MIPGQVPATQAAAGSCVVRYRCITCSREYETADVVYRCPSCAPRGAESFGKGNLVTLTSPPAGAEPGQPVDPHAFLPIPISGSPAYPVGNTPLVEPSALRQRTGFPRLYLKNDAVNPSGSLKDRASLLVAEQAMAHGDRR